MTAAEIRSRIAPFGWLHTIDLGQGVITPGQWTCAGQAHIAALMDRVDYHGKSVLDVGTCDGRWAFEAEGRGASSILTIDIDPRPTFALARSILASRVEQAVCDVMDAGSLPYRFDLIQCFGVYYHLTDPLGAFRALHSCLATGGALLVEGAVTAGSEPVARFVRDTYQDDPTNWWIPTPACLVDWIEASGFRVTWRAEPLQDHDGRYTLIAERKT